MTDNDIKYEAVFGDQSLFDGMMNDCEFASEEYGYMFANGALYYCERYNEKAGWSLSCKSHLTFKPSAMRRIIRTPTWTVADQKAGKLPEVGCLAVFTLKNGIVQGGNIYNWEDGDEIEILKVFSSAVACVCNKSKKWAASISMTSIKPIETPREKYDRERDECIDKLLAKIPPSPITVVPAMKIVYEELRPFTGGDHD